MRDNFVFLVIFDTCDVVYKWFISLLPPIVLDNLFEPTGPSINPNLFWSKYDYGF